MLNQMLQLENDLRAFIAAHPGLVVLMVAGNPFDDYADQALIATIENFELEGVEGRPAAEKRYKDAMAEATARGLFKSAGRRSDPNPMAAQRPAYGTGARIGAGPAGDFQDWGDFAASVRASSARGAQIDPRLIANAPTTTSTEGTGSDGGFLVPPDFQKEIWQKVTGVTHLLDLCSRMPTPSNSYVLPADEAAPWDTASGPQAQWLAEGSQFTQSKISLQDQTRRLNKLGVLVPCSDELIEDAASLDGYLRRTVPQRMHAALNQAIFAGTGAGQPLGIINSASIVSIAPESGQAADTVVAANIMNMWARLYAGCASNAVWLVNQDAIPAIMQMEFPSANQGVFPVWMPPGGLSAAPHGTLMGRPVIPTEVCETLGDSGDVVLVDMSQYLCIVKTAGLRTDVSIHMFFDYGVTAYRFVLRVGGQPLWASYITPRNGTNYLSWAVKLDERA